MSEPRFVRRLVVELGERASTALDRRVAAEGINKTTVVNRALQTYDLVAAHQEAGGAVELIQADGTRERLRLL